ncbi:hypothetical protein M4755_002045 [Salmonella enterica]|nr:hypothetical protein [Salmonella enterica]SUG39524.1 Uncharacterised protein [Salmonella enterica subsp. arizonae]ECE1694426.1 hypothetical protein [Salmonella enterica]EDJ0434758.1 hypothetical protein [Salmonella enterica]EJE5203381.1 hypothetical protein [Salmonella enterica]
MSGSKNAVERKLAELESLWLEASDDENIRIFIWRTPADSDRLIHVFFALQEERQNGFTTPDLFIRFNTPFETRYGYSHELEEEFIERVNVTEFPESRWQSTRLRPCYRTDTLYRLLSDFAHYHQDYLRYLAVLLTPASVSNADSNQRFINELSQHIVTEASRFRLLLVDTHENPDWQWLLERFPENTRLLTPDISEDELMRQTLNETPTSDGTAMLRFRQRMTDTFISLKKGAAAQTEQLAQKALELARQQGWGEQQVIMLSMAAGGWLQEKHAQNAIKNYRLAVQTSADLPPESRHSLITQNLMGEGNAWFMDKNHKQASDAYYRSAQEALNIPSLLLAMEGYRMAGFSLMSVTPPPAEIAQHYYAALKTGLSMNNEERTQSGFMQIFRDLLNWLSPEATSRSDDFSKRYLKGQAELIQQAEEAVNQAGHSDITATVVQHDNELTKKMEVLFQNILLERESMLSQEKPIYQQVLRLARQYSHAFWTPGIEITHPLNKPVETWSFKSPLVMLKTMLLEEGIYSLFVNVVSGKQRMKS